MPRILIVDDEPLVRNKIASVLETQGYEVEIAISSQMALQMCKSRRFDLTLVDYNLPSTNGIELLEDFRTLQPSCLRILITDMLNVHLATKELNRGLLTNFVEKPYTSEKLLGTVKGVVAIREKMIEVAKIQRQASRIEEEKILQECFQNDNIYVALQPIIGSAEGKIFAFEIFMRSKHPILNNPAGLLRAVRKHNKLEKLSEIIFSKVLDVLKKIEGDYLLFLNIHCDELANKKELLSRLDILKEYASRIVFEVTERNRLKSIVGWEENIASMKKMGFRIAIDNLGVENTTLSILSDIEPNFFKIDMSMIRSINQEPKHRKFVELLCKLGVTMDVQIVAEGIEREEELVIVRSCGTQLLQGFYFEKPSSDIGEIQRKLHSSYL